MSKPLVPDDLSPIVEPLVPPEPPKPRGGWPWVPDRAGLTGIIVHELGLAFDLTNDSQPAKAPCEEKAGPVGRGKRPPQGTIASKTGDEDDTRGGDIDVLGERTELHSSPLQVGDGLDQMFERTPLRKQSGLFEANLSAEADAC